MGFLNRWSPFAILFVMVVFMVYGYAMGYMTEDGSGMKDDPVVEALSWTLAALFAIAVVALHWHNRSEAAARKQN